MTPKTLLITGASSGIGKAIAQKGAERGYHLVLVARRLNKLKELAETLKSQFAIEVLCVELDISQKKEVEQALVKIYERVGSIDVLINNAGAACGRDRFDESDLEDLDRMIDTNVKGLLYVTHGVLKKMREKGTGHILQIGSLAGREVYPTGTVYCASKHAVRAINEGLKKEVHETPIRVTSIDPGLVETEFSLVRFKGDVEKAASVYSGMKPLMPQDVAEAVFFALSQPAHVNISEILMMPTDQSGSGMVKRDTV